MVSMYCSTPYLLSLMNATLSSFFSFSLCPSVFYLSVSLSLSLSLSLSVCLCLFSSVYLFVYLSVRLNCRLHIVLRSSKVIVTGGWFSSPVLLTFWPAQLKTEFRGNQGIRATFRPFRRFKWIALYYGCGVDGSSLLLDDETILHSADLDFLLLVSFDSKRKIK